MGNSPNTNNSFFVVFVFDRAKHFSKSHDVFDFGNHKHTTQKNSLYLVFSKQD